jgi:peptidoglycan/LPS O-acetylase OafA/YrhL
MEQRALRAGGEGRSGWASKLLSRVGRQTTSGLYIPEIDGLRSLAILMVIFFHTQVFIDAQFPARSQFTPLEQWFRDWATSQAWGVQVFFVISGFVIALPFAAHFLLGQRKVSIKQFYLRRLTRLEPTYIINLLMNAVVRVFTDHLPVLMVIERFIAGVFYAHGQIYEKSQILNQAAWSLEIEFQFYFLAPILLAALAIKQPWLRRAALVLPVILIIWLRPDVWRVDKSLLGKCEYFISGIILCDIYLTRWKGKLPRLLRLDALAFLGWAAFSVLIYIPGVHDNLIATLRPIALFIAFYGTLGGKILSSIFRNAWVAAFGGMCYTVYLFHSTIISVMMRATKRFTDFDSYFATYFAQFVMVIVPIVIGSTVLFLFLEKPFMNKNWPQQFWSWLQARFRPAEPESRPVQAESPTGN